MINYIYCNFVRCNNLQITLMHLFEHCFYKKLSLHLNSKFKDSGIVVDANTSTNSVFIEIYYTNINLSNKILHMVESVKFFDEDLKWILKEKELVIHEISADDLGYEEEIMYKALPFISDNNIFDLYDKDIGVIDNSIITLFNQMLSDMNIIKYESEVLRKLKYKNTYNNLFKYPKNFFDSTEKFIYGSIRTKMNCLRDIVSSMFISFIYAKNSESIIQDIYINDFGLYLAYTIDIPIYDDYCIMFLIEYNKKSYSVFTERKSKVSYDNLDQKFINRQKEGFLTYMALNDPNLREFSKFYCQAPFKLDTVTINDIKNELYNLTDNEINEIVRKGGFYD